MGYCSDAWPEKSDAGVFCHSKKIWGDENWAGELSGMGLVEGRVSTGLPGRGVGL